MKPQPFPPDEADDQHVSAEDIENAADEIRAGVAAPETDERTASLTEWDAPPEASGHRAPKVRPEDDGNVVEELVEEGIEEADRDQRLAATDPDFEP